MGGKQFFKNVLNLKSGAGAILHCFPQTVSRELDLKYSNQDTKQNPYVLCHTSLAALQGWHQEAFFEAIISLQRDLCGMLQ